MKIYTICKQKYEEDGKTKHGAIQFRTIDNGWSELNQYSAIFTEAHADYISGNLQRIANVNKKKDKFFKREIYNVR